MFSGAWFTIAAGFDLDVFMCGFTNEESFSARLIFGATGVRSAVAFIMSRRKWAATVVYSFFQTDRCRISIKVAINSGAFCAIRVPTLIFFTMNYFWRCDLRIKANVQFYRIRERNFALTGSNSVAFLLVFIYGFVSHFDAVLRSPGILRANVATTCSVNDRSMQDG